MRDARKEESKGGRKHEKRGWIMGEIKQNLIKFPFNIISQKYKIETHTIEIRFFQFSYYILLYLIISYYFLLFLIISYHFLLFLIISNYFLSFLIISYHFLLFLTIFP